MQEISGNYDEIMQNPHRFEVSIGIDGTGCISTEDDEVITFGGVGIITGDTDADGGYKMNVLRSVSVDRQSFPDGSPSIGNAPSAEIDIEMLKPTATLPKQAKMKVYIRAVSDEDSNTHSEWIPQGTFYIDTREEDTDFYSTPIMNIHGYDRMIYAEQDYTGEGEMEALAVLEEIADKLGVKIADDTVEMVETHNYVVCLVTGFSCREVLSQIAGMYGGNCVVDCEGKISIIPLFT